MTLSPSDIPWATAARPVPEDAPLDHPHLYFNRELGTIDFNWRVLHQGLDARTPLLERVFFLAITGSNLDEFFRKRVGGLKRQVAAGVRTRSHDGRSPREQLRLIREAVLRLYDAMASLWRDDLKPLLREEAGVCVQDYDELSSDQQAQLRSHFQENVFPILTPLAVGPGHPFPFISNLSLSLAVVLRREGEDAEHFARVKVPMAEGRWVPLDEPHHVVALEQVIAHNLGELFRGMEIVSVSAFRVTRNADIRRDEEEAEDLLELISEELRERRFAPVVRLEIDRTMPQTVRERLMHELEIGPDDVYETDGPLGHADFMDLSALDLPAHRFEPWEPVVPARLAPEDDDERDTFSVLREGGDLLVHHPYDSFEASVQRLLEEAADDPHVLAIKQTLYRTSEGSPIVMALLRAAEQRKQVVVLVEVKARFDEASNIEWGELLEKAGAHVTYGLVGLKTHTKVLLIVRREDDTLRTYCHVGTGNYNPKTARQYTDLGLLTCDADIGYDLVNLFHHLTGHAPEQHYRKLLVAPDHLRGPLYAMIHQEVANQEAHGNGRIVAKMNALNDVGTIRELYKASQAGVQIDLIVRGHSRLRPGLPGYSEHIRILSILGRFLEHTRIYCFHNNGAPRVFIGSADWMSRNLNDRVEAVVEVEHPDLKDRLADILHAALTDRRSAWELDAEGRYTLRYPETGDDELGFQERLMQWARQRREAGVAP